MQNKKEQWTVLKRLMSYLKPYGLLTFLALSFLLATTVIKSVIPLVASISTNSLRPFCWSIMAFISFKL